MSVEMVKEYLAQFGAADRVREFEASTATVELAAQAAGVEPGRIAKTLSFKLEDRTILVVAAGDVKVDNVKYKNTFGGKAKMLTPQEAVERVGHAVGGVCPFAVKEGVEVLPLRREGGGGGVPGREPPPLRDGPPRRRQRQQLREADPAGAGEVLPGQPVGGRVQAQDSVKPWYGSSMPRTSI